MWILWWIPGKVFARGCVLSMHVSCATVNSLLTAHTCTGLVHLDMLVIRLEKVEQDAHALYNALLLPAISHARGWGGGGV